MLAELLLPARHCLWCGGDVSDRKSTAKFCCDEHKQKHWERRHPGRRPARRPEPSYNGNSRRSRPISRRQPTRYVVFRAEGDQLVKIDTASADRSARAKRLVAEAHGLEIDELRTVPKHNLR